MRNRPVRTNAMRGTMIPAIAEVDQRQRRVPSWWDAQRNGRVGGRTEADDERQRTSGPVSSVGSSGLALASISLTLCRSSRP